MPEINREQAEIPENCVPIQNKNGTAPGMWFETPISKNVEDIVLPTTNNQLLISLPNSLINSLIN